MSISRFASLAAVTVVLSGVRAHAQDLNGAGATFPAPLYLQWFNEYAGKTGVKINYQPIGSGGGVKAFTEGTVDFGASDAPLSDEELGKLKAPAYHIPTVLGSVVLTYNLPEVKEQLTLNGPVIADIYLGKATKWNAPEIAALNPGVKLPSKDILVVHRSDGSGTTYIFTDYLTAVSPAWAAGPKKGKDVQWPVGLGGAQNAGVMNQVRQLPGAIGYVELNYAHSEKVPYAKLKNAAGKVIEPTLESVTAAAAGVASKLPANTDFRVSLVNSPSPDAYPIASFTYILVSETQANAEKGKKLIDFLKWAVHGGELEAPAKDYAPLPKNVVAIIDKRLAAVKNVAAK